MAVLASTDIRFTATVDDETVKLSWTRLSGSFVYVVERSTDNSTWKPISHGNELKFTSDKILFVDNSPNKGINFYRVKMMGASNVIKYSAVRLVDINNTDVIQIWPNPVAHELFIQNSGEFSSLVIYDLTGNTVKSVRITNGINKINLTGLPSGEYFVSLSTPDRRRKAYRIIKK
jgi:hypothetical protein